MSLSLVIQRFTATIMADNFFAGFSINLAEGTLWICARTCDPQLKVVPLIADKTFSQSHCPLVVSTCTFYFYLSLCMSYSKKLISISDRPLTKLLKNLFSVAFLPDKKFEGPKSLWTVPVYIRLYFRCTLCQPTEATWSFGRGIHNSMCIITCTCTSVWWCEHVCWFTTLHVQLVRFLLNVLTRTGIVDHVTCSTWRVELLGDECRDVFAAFPQYQLLSHVLVKRIQCI